MISLGREISDYYDIIIVGAGPSGLATANELVERGIPGSKILIVDMGPDISQRVKSRNAGSDKFNTYGLGGAGLFSDGKLSLFPASPGLVDVVGSADEVRELYEYAYDLFSGLGSAVRYDQVDEDLVHRMRDLFRRLGVYYHYYPVRQIEPGHLPQVVHGLRKRLESAGVTVQLFTRVSEVGVEKGQGLKVLKCRNCTGETVLGCRFLVFAVGKIGTQWLIEQSDRLGIAKAHRPVEIGARVEVARDILDPFTRVHRDLKLFRRIDDSTVVRTFCTCPGGIVLPCQYGDALVLGGYTCERASPNTNFALLAQIDPNAINPIEYGRSVVRTVNIVGQGRPLVQRLGDMRRGIASAESDIRFNAVRTTLPVYTPGNIALALPKFIVDALLETLRVLDQAIPGINDDSNVVSAPCLERCYPKFIVSRHMETNISGIYVVGDIGGHVRGIIQAAATGVLGARGIAGHMESRVVPVKLPDFARC